MTHTVLLKPTRPLPTGNVWSGMGIFNFGLISGMTAMLAMKLMGYYTVATQVLVVSTVLIVKVDFGCPGTTSFFILVHPWLCHTIHGWTAPIHGRAMWDTCFIGIS